MISTIKKRCPYLNPLNLKAYKFENRNIQWAAVGYQAARLFVLAESCVHSYNPKTTNSHYHLHVKYEHYDEKDNLGTRYCHISK